MPFPVNGPPTVAGQPKEKETTFQSGKVQDEQQEAKWDCHLEPRLQQRKQQSNGPSLEETALGLVFYTPPPTTTGSTGMVVSFFVGGVGEGFGRTLKCSRVKPSEGICSVARGGMRAPWLDLPPNRGSVTGPHIRAEMALDVNRTAEPKKRESGSFRIRPPRWSTQGVIRIVFGERFCFDLF